VNQVAKDEKLLDIANDCFQFVTKFFEVINVSAVHIYHSALELCPMSSIIRKLYYHRRITRLPNVVIGTPELWAQTIGVTGKDHYHGPCAWSPCGRFVAAQTRKVVEIRNQLTLELSTILQPTETIPHLTGPLAYSPDGRSIACASDTAIIIWDIQTGGVAKEIECSANNTSLVWSSDGRTLCTINSWDQGTFAVHTHDVSSGTTSSPGTLESGDIPHLWADDGSFWAVAVVQNRDFNINAIGTIRKTANLLFPLF
jgi:WD40 repeat protein